MNMTEEYLLIRRKVAQLVDDSETPDDLDWHTVGEYVGTRLDDEDRHSAAMIMVMDMVRREVALRNESEPV